MDTSMETIESRSPISIPTLGGSTIAVFIYWYFVVAPKNILGIWNNYLAAVMHYFSVPLLFRTLFSYWHRDLEGYERASDLGSYFAIFTINLLSRIFGFVVRIWTIFFSFIALLCVCLIGGICLLGWVAAPIVIPFAFSHQPNVYSQTTIPLTVPHVAAPSYGGP